MTTKDIKILFQEIQTALQPFGLAAQYVFAPFPDINAAFNYDAPLMFVDNQIFVTRAGYDTNKAQLNQYDVALYWLDIPREAGSAGAGVKRFEIDENIKPKIEVVWDAVWGLLCATPSYDSVWGDPADGYTMAPIEYEGIDGWTGFRIEFKLYGRPSAAACDFKLLAGNLVKVCNNL